MKNTLKKIITYILTVEAKLVLKKYKPKIVAVTGSVGKTSTKDAIYTAFLPFFHVRKSAKSYNSEIGIPVTILGVENAWSDPKKWAKNIFDGLILILFKKEYPEWLVLEIGADRPGDIEKTCKWIKPDISVITRIGSVPVHVEFYKLVEDVIKEKSFLAFAVKKDGVLILNSDDEDVLSFKEYSQARTITYGIQNSSSDVRGTYSQITYDENGKPTGMSIKADVIGNSLPISVSGVLGNQHLYPALAAFAAAHSENLNLVEVASSFTKHISAPGRMNIIDGIKSSTIIDDTYNASPIALEEGINILGEVTTKGKKIAILGDMLELGKYSSSEHKRLGELVAKNFDILVAVGIRAKDYAVGALEAKMKKSNILLCDEAKDVPEITKNLIHKGDCIYIKGSQGMRMERVVKALMEHPEEASKLLVRQDEEWLSR